MLSRKFIDSAINIRKNYIKLSKEILTLEGDVKNIAEELEKGSNELSEISSSLKDSGKTKDEIQNMLTEKLIKIQTKAEGIDKLYTPLNERMEVLKTEETELYENIKESYPDLSDEEIIKHLEPHLSEIK